VSAPGAIQPFERTEIYSKIPGFVRRWHVDLGDRVKKDQLMAELEVPELVEQINEFRASVQQVRDVVSQLEQMVIVAERNRDVASNAIAEATGEIERYTAELTRRRSEHVRLKELLEARSISQRVVEEAEEHQHAAQATLRVAQLTVMTRETELLSAVASVGKAKADVRAAQSTVQVAEATVRRYEALLDYTKIKAPYDGIVTQRNVSAGDLVRSGTGTGVDVATQAATSATPLFVLSRVDKVMFVSGIPELDAAEVTVGTPIRIDVQAIGLADFPCKVTRTSWSISAESRTLAVQVDLPNSKGTFMPGMYATGTITLERDNALSVSRRALVAAGDHWNCFFAVDGHAVERRVEVGLCDDEWAQLLKKQVKTDDGKVDWQPIEPHDEIIISDPSQITSGVAIASALK
jgi:multidrug efflux pump subunit AcrA (membrane-fusion protein)